MRSVKARDILSPSQRPEILLQGQNRGGSTHEVWNIRDVIKIGSLWIFNQGLSSFYLSDLCLRACALTVAERQENTRGQTSSFTIAKRQAALMADGNALGDTQPQAKTA